MKKVFFSTVLFSLLINSFALDFALRITPVAVLPSDNDLDTGFGGLVNFDLDLFNFVTVGVEGGYTTIKQKPLDKNFNIFMGGASLGLYYYPLSRLYLSANGSFGVHSISIDAPSVSDDGSGLYYRGFGELGFRFTPGFVLSAVGGYESFMIDGSDYISAPFIGLSAKFNFSGEKKSSSSFLVDFEQDSTVFPVHSNMYKSVPFGYATVRNVGTAEARDVHISFRSGKYSATEKECASVSNLGRYKSIEVPLCADFSSELLCYSEDGKINGELVIDYNFLGKHVREVQNIVIEVNHRNSFSWNDSAALASFIDNQTPEILEAAKYLAGTEIINLKPGMNTAFQYSAAILEGLRLSGLVYSEDTMTPYREYSLGEKIDSIQYPLQTLALLSGDYDDLGLLVCSCLESFSINTGFIAMNDDFIVLVDTGIAPDKKSNQFIGDDVIADSNTTWLALSMANFSKGFTQARLGAAKKLVAMQQNPQNTYEIVDVHSAWEYYPPVTFTGYKGSYKNPSKDSVTKAVNEATSYYINNDLSQLTKKFRAEGQTKLLADCYVRQGMYAEALAEYQKINTPSAWNNMGLVYMAQKNYKSALSMYNKVIAKEPENKIALAGIKKIKALTGE